MKGVSLFVPKKTFFATYSNVDGLLEANPVQINGMKVGSVRTVEFIPDNSGRILVSFHITKDISIPKNSTAKIVSSNLMNAKAVDLVFGDSKEMAKSGDTLNSELQLSIGQEVNKQIAPIKAKAESMLSSIDSVLMVIQGIFNTETRESLSGSMQKIQDALEALSHASLGIDTLVTTQRVKLRSIFDNLESISSNVKNNNEKISNAITNFSNISDTLAKAQLAETILKTKEAVTQISEIMAKVNRGEGSLGLLIKDDSLYTNLNATSRDLDMLVKDINENPKRYVHFSIIGGGSKKKQTKK